MVKRNKRNKEITPFYDKFVERKPLSLEELEIAYQIVKKNRLVCLICGEEKENLASHINRKHKISVREYKNYFGLPYTLPLISDEMIEKKKEIVKLFPTWKKNFKKSKKYWFKKGKKFPYSRTSYYITRKRLEDIEKYNQKVKKEWGICYVCGSRFRHLASHLFLKHGLIKIKPSKSLFS